MFYSASAFNNGGQPLAWGNKTAKVTNMEGMFSSASSFNQNISSWDVSNVTDMSQMFYYVTLSTINYDALLTAWSTLTLQPDVTFDAGMSRYLTSGTARDTIINTFNWTIYDEGLYRDPTTIIINSLSDEGDGTCTTVCTFRDAINTSSSGDTIEFAEGMTGTITLSKDTQITIDQNLTIIGPGSDLMTIDFGGPDYYQPGIYQSGGDLSISGLTITHGNTPIQVGGSNSLNLSDIIFIDNPSYSALYVNDLARNRSVNINNCQFINNAEINGDGGGAIFIYGSGDLNISNSIFSGNISDSSQGGGAIDVNGGNVTITNSTFTGNTATSNGGAINFSSSGNLEISDSTFNGNRATQGGGSIYSNNGNLTIDSSSFLGNTSDNNYGGTISYNGNNDLSVSNSTFDSNNGNNFGVVYISGSQNSATITNSTLANNDSTGGGSGGIEIDGGNLDIINTTFSENINASDSGTIANYGSSNVNLINSIIFSITDGSCYISSGTTINSLGHNIDSGNSCGFTAEGDQINTDPKLDPEGLKDNGGPVKTIALLIDSLAINAGDDTKAPSTDARGYTRLGVSDIGAYEYGGIPPVETCADGIKNQNETSIDTGGVCTPTPEPTPVVSHSSGGGYTLGYGTNTTPPVIVSPTIPTPPNKDGCKR